MVYASLFKPSPVRDKSEWKTIASPGRGILAMDESSATCRERLASIGLENKEANHQAYRTCLFQLSNSDIVPAPIKVAVLESWGLAGYATVSQDNGLVSVVELEILLDGDFGIGRTFEVAKKVWAEVFFYLAQKQCDVQRGYLAPNPWHVSFSYARALQNTCLKKWEGGPENVKEAQDVLLVSAKANSLAQLVKYMGEGWSEEAKQGMFVKGYVY
ncbi:hypothetical protein Gohar_018147 [Gossypium harknessii]|uniref:fructose-bisphosphate aldolase n=1 Tax=Gossypium harknessii TaxID=34285 RepID=A0A7J9G896_9ROSI|nr:hypothetical protein [Gossypium harknessii]